MEIGKAINHLVRDSIFNSTQYKLYYIVRDATHLSERSGRSAPGMMQDRLNLLVYMQI